MKLVGFAITIIFFILSIYLFQHNASGIILQLKSLGWVGMVLFLLLYCMATILLLPTMIITLAGGALFGPLLGTILNLAGATSGAICAFAISRYFSQRWFISNKKLQTHKLIAGVERGGWQFIALLRLIPIIPFNLVNYGLGVTNIKFGHYCIATIIFLLPAEILYTYCGYVGMDILTNANWSNTSLLIGLGVFLVLFSFLIHSLNNNYRKKQSLVKNDDVAE